MTDDGDDGDDGISLSRLPEDRFRKGEENFRGQ